MRAFHVKVNRNVRNFSIVLVLFLFIYPRTPLNFRLICCRYFQYFLVKLFKFPKTTISLAFPKLSTSLLGTKANNWQIIDKNLVTRVHWFFNWNKDFPKFYKNLKTFLVIFLSDLEFDFSLASDKKYYFDWYISFRSSFNRTRNCNFLNEKDNFLSIKS